MAKTYGTVDPTRKKPLPEIREDYEDAKNQWHDTRTLAADDMQYVLGNPWTPDDEDAREGRPTVAPDEMTQYRNQVTNGLRRSPRGAAFQPAGNGADKRTAEFYQNKMREIEYRSHAVDAYIGAAENVLQRSYGAFRIGMRYEDPRDLNPEIYIDGFPDPDVVLPDPAIRKRYGQDMKYCFVLDRLRRSDFKRRWPGAAVTNFGDFVDRYKDWVIGSKLIQVAEYWKVETYKRELRAVVLGIRGRPEVPQKPMALFADELERVAKRGQVQILANREVRTVDYPKVTRKITNGIEVLETLEWPGKYIPIVMLYGPTLYVPQGGETKRIVLSMTRAGKAPWKSYCYACSQELEILGQVPKAAAVAYEGQLAGHEEEWEESLQKPKAFLYAKRRVPGMKETEEGLPLPARMEYAQADYLQMIELVKEGFRRAIQAAMGSNFLPTQAQKMNDKSGIALDKIDEAAAQGTYFFVDTYEGAVWFGGVIIEDLMDKVHDYTGDTDVMDAKGDSKTVRINDSDDPEAFSTRGDHLVTITTAPSSSSEYDAVEKFIDVLVSNLQMIAQVAGPKAAAAVLARSIKMRNLGVGGDDLVDILLPEEYKAKDGKPPDPRVQAAEQQIQQLTQQLQQMGMVIHSKQIEGMMKYKIEKMKADVTSADKAADRAVKLDVAAIQAKIETMAIVFEELKRIGGLNSDAAQRLADAGQATLERSHDHVERTADRLHERHVQGADHAHQRAQAAVGAVIDAQGQNRQAEIDSAQSAQDAAQQPEPAGDGSTE